MNTNHTPEPWFSGDNAIAGSDGATVAYIGSESDGARIVKCVNACAGIEDPAAYIEAMRRELRRLVDLCDTEATMFDGSNPDTRAAHALLGDFDKPADEDDGGSHMWLRPLGGA